MGYSYDPMGRVLNFYRCSPFFCAAAGPSAAPYTYDLAGDLTTYGQGFEDITFTNSVNAAQQVTQLTSTVSDGSHPGTLGNFSYTPFGAMAKVVDGCAPSGCTNLQETYDYNNRLQPVRIQVGTSGAPAQDNCLVYNYYGSGYQPSGCAIPTQNSAGGNNGSVMGYLYQDSVNASLGHSATFTYDGLNRLTNAQATGNSTYNLPFSLDRYGNMSCQLTQQTQGLCALETFNGATNQVTTPGYSYDASGNVTGDGTHTYHWDAEGRLTGMDNNTFTYNALGERVEESRGGGSSYLETYWDVFGNPLVTYDRTTEDEIFVAPVNGRNFVKYINSRTDFLHTNVLGSTGMITDNAGNVLPQDQLYYPWGQTWNSNVTNDVRFGGMRERDAVTGLDPTVARQYNSNIGRWLTPDPDNAGAEASDPQSWNAYSYAGNNPTTNIDPTGEACVQNNNGTWYNDNSGGQTCEEAFSPEQNNTPSATVTAQAPEASYVTAPFIRDAVIIGQQFQFVNDAAFDFYSGFVNAFLNGRLSGVGQMGIGIATMLPGGKDLKMAEEIGISRNSLKHIAAHLNEFKELDPSMTLEKLTELAKRISDDATNFVGTKGGRKFFEAVVQIGSSEVRVRVGLINTGLYPRTIYIVK